MWPANVAIVAASGSISKTSATEYNAASEDRSASDCASSTTSPRLRK
ncbi:hypothetical protein [Lysobacter gummosus]